MTFANSMQAKEFLVSRIIEEARREQLGLSEVERKMLYFSEQYPALPDMIEVNEKFEAEYDSDEYERKVRRLTKSAFEHDRQESTEYAERWQDAIRILKREDHYLVVMLDIPRPLSDVVKLFVTGVVITALGIAVTVAYNWANEHIRFRVPDFVAVLVFLFAFAMAYYLVFSSQGKKLGESIGRLFERVAKWF